MAKKSRLYLFDGTVADNIAFGKAKILDFLDGIHTYVGGIKLSGGQKQRIARARNLGFRKRDNG